MSINMTDGLTICPEQRYWFNSKGPDAPIAWYGGKHYLARWIIEQMPETESTLNRSEAWRECC